MGEHLPRKLAAILYADVAGYSRLTGADEEGTHRRLSEYLDLVSDEVDHHNGSVVHFAGDAVLADFGTVTDAVTCATSIQSKLTDRNQTLPEEQKLRFRIGINLGEVIVDRDDIYGDGVNVAARLEGLADVGGICVSESIRSAIGNKLAVDYEFMGERMVKNIADPIRAYQLRIRSGDPEATASPEKPSLEPPSEPSIAVLPFTNMSDDPEQEYFSDGITEDIITALSKIGTMMVISRSSTFTYKGKTVDVKRVGREQGVRYVLEGSVRKSGERVRITAQLIDATTDHHVWAERYDRDLHDIFSVQDEIVREIVVALDVELGEGEQIRAWSSGTDNLTAWECVRLGAKAAIGGDPNQKIHARKLIEKALELDPNYAMAWVMLGWIHHADSDVAFGKSAAGDEGTAFDPMRECAQKAIDLDSSCADAYSLMSMYYREMNEFDAAIKCAEKSIALAPNNAENLAVASGTMTKFGKPERGLELIQRAMRVCPLYRPGFLRALALAYRVSGNPEAAVNALRESLKRESTYLAPHVNLTSILGELGRLDEAREAARGVLRLAPDFSIGNYMKGLSYRNPEDKRRVEDGLRIAGLPE